MALSDFINVQISIAAARATGPGFGIPLILSSSATWANRVRSYSSAAGVAGDFAVTTPEYRSAAALFSQTPSVPIVKVGRANAVPTQAYSVVPTAVNNTAYTVHIIDTAGVQHDATYTSTGAATLALIIGGLKTAIDAFGLALTTANVGPNVSLSITANAVGAWWSIWVDSSVTGTLMQITETEADPGYAADLGGINTEDANWYCLLSLFQSKAIIVAIDAWVEANGPKLYVARSEDGPIRDTALSGATDVAATLKGSAAFRTAVIYHAINHEMADAAFAGVFLPMISGSEMWAFKTLVGVTFDQATEGQRTNTLAKNANLVEQVASVNITNQGKVASGEWIDIVRFRDWLASDIAIRIYNVLVANSKISYDDDGIPKIAQCVKDSLKAGQRAGGIVKGDPDPNTPTTTYNVSIPLAVNVSPSDHTARNLSLLSFSAKLAGAISTVNPLNGVITE